jgi:hypothetical protein
MENTTAYLGFPEASNTSVKSFGRSAQEKNLSEGKIWKIFNSFQLEVDFSSQDFWRIRSMH